MNPRILHAVPIAKFKLLLTFADGVSGEVDLATDIVGRGGVFKPLEDPRYFQAVAVDADAGTIVWPNGVDLDPDVLYHRVTGQPLPHERVKESAGR